MLMVTHDKEMAKRVPRVVEITNGKITRDEYARQQNWLDRVLGQLSGIQLTVIS